MKNLLILGAGQYGYVAKEIAESMGCFEKIDFLDDRAEFAVGKVQDYQRFAGTYGCAVIAIGNPQIRLPLFEKIQSNFEMVSLVSPLSYVSSGARIGRGCVIEPMAVVHPNALVSDCCIISAGAVVNHNSVLQEGCHVDCNAAVAANAVVPSGVKIPSCTVYQKKDM